MSVFSSPSGYSCWLKGTSACVIPKGHFWKKPVPASGSQTIPKLNFLRLLHSRVTSYALWNLKSLFWFSQPQVISVISYSGYPSSLLFNIYCIKIWYLFAFVKQILCSRKNESTSEKYETNAWNLNKPFLLGKSGPCSTTSQDLS